MKHPRFVRFLQLAAQEEASENDIYLLKEAIQRVRRDGRLRNRDPDWQTFQVIENILDKALSSLAKRRVNKSVKLQCSTSLQRFINIRVLSLESRNHLGKKYPQVKDPQLKNALEYLTGVIIPRRKMSSEKDLEKYLATSLSQVFGNQYVQRQYNIPGFLGLKSDIDLYDGRIGIELKVGDLNATEMQRLIGQTVYYSKRQYGNQLIVLVASKSGPTPAVKELEKFIAGLGVIFIHREGIVV